jgi:hypothetical protein
MKPRAFEFRLSSVSGVFAVLIVGIIAFVGVAVVVVGLAVSICAALWYAVRRRLEYDSVKPVWIVHDQSASSSSIKVQEIEVEMLPKEERR